MVTIYNCDGSSAAGRWVAATPVDKCRPLGYGTAHTRDANRNPKFRNSFSGQDNNEITKGHQGSNFEKVAVFANKRYYL